MREIFYFVGANTIVGQLYLRDGRYQDFMTGMNHYPTAEAATSAMLAAPHYAARIWRSDEII